MNNEKNIERFEKEVAKIDKERRKGVIRANDRKV